MKIAIIIILALLLLIILAICVLLVIIHVVNQYNKEVDKMYDNELKDRRFKL